jgi:hypothetical protein
LLPSATWIALGTVGPGGPARATCVKDNRRGSDEPRWQQAVQTDETGSSSGRHAKDEPS